MSGKIIRGFSSIFSAKAIALPLTLVINPIIVRLLGSSRYGDYAFLLSILGITMVVVDLGLFDGTRKYIAEDRGDQDWTEHVVGFSFRVGLLVAAGTAAIYSLFAWIGIIDGVYGDGYAVYFYILALLIIARQLLRIIRGGLMGLGLESRSEPLKVVQKVLFGGISISLAYVGFGVLGVLAGQLIATVFGATVGGWILLKRLNIKEVMSVLPPDFPREEVFSFNIQSVILILLTTSLYHVDILLLRTITGSQVTGYYKAALTIVEFLWFVPLSLQTVLLHSSSELWSNEEQAKINNIISKVTRYNLSLTLLMGIGLTSLATDFIPLYYGPGFEAAVTPLLLLLPGTIGFALARPIFAIGQGKGELRMLIIATGSAALTNLILNLILIPRYGMRGAAVSTSIGYGLMLIAHIWAVRKLGVNPLSGLKIPQIALTSLISAPLIFILNQQIQSALISVIIVPPIGFIVFVGLALRLGIIDDRDKARARKQMESMLDR